MSGHYTVNAHKANTGCTAVIVLRHINAENRMFGRVEGPHASVSSSETTLVRGAAHTPEPGARETP
jgi:hypothetical protein